MVRPKDLVTAFPPILYSVYFFLDLYHVLSTSVTNYKYYLFYIFSVLWGGYNLCCVIYTLHFAIMSWKSEKFSGREDMSLKNIKKKLDEAEYDYLDGLLSHSKGYWIILVFISCLGLMVDISYYKLETSSPKKGRAIMVILDIILVIVNTFMYNISLMTRF